MNTITPLSADQMYSTWDIDSDFEELLSGAKPGDGFEIELKDGLTLASAQRRLDSAARRVLHKRLEFRYRSDGKVLRFKVTDVYATDYGRRSRRYQKRDRFDADDKETLAVTADSAGVVTNVTRIPARSKS